ncbi:hypothetical protein OAK47_00160 [Planctomycetaceae bacterium]|jgi:hypothetical protein|nr:hypothetical protein [Planctomycetaceae bacterium]MDG2391214.1 hypothetical protein [Planctomycetaceae bacterium]
MRMESLSKKTVTIFLMSCGVSGMMTVSAHAQWGWNPFSSRSQAPPQATQEKSSFFNSPFELKSPLNNFGSENKTAARTTGNVQSARPISDSTRRAIVELSRNYSLQQRQLFIKSFAGLTDQQAQQRLQLAANAQSGGKRPASPTTQPATQYASRVQQSQSSEQARLQAEVDYRNQQSAGQRRSTRPVAQSPLGLGQGNPWGATNSQQPRIEQSMIQTSYQQPQQSGMSQTRPASKTTVQNPFLRRQQGLGQQSQQQNASSQGRASMSPAPSVYPPNSGYDRSRVPQENHPGMVTTQSNISVKPERDQKSLMPVIRPASSEVNTSHYEGNYQPAKSEVAPQRFEPVTTAVPTSRASAQPVNQFVPSREIGGPELSLLISRAEALAASSTPGPSEEAKQQHITRHVDLRLLYLLSGQRDRALMAIPGVPKNEQAFWTRTFWALSNYLDHPNYPDKSDRTTVALEQLRSAIKSLQGDAHLVVRNAAFCSEIDSFGSYQRFEREEFAPSQDVLIYSELDNFKSEQTSECQYRTVLKSSIRIIEAGPNGRVIDTVDYSPTEDLCHSQRGDFMQGYKYQLPARITPGSYVMQLAVEDQLSGKRANYSMNFLVR